MPRRAAPPNAVAATVAASPVAALVPKKQPEQQRGVETYQRILHTTAELLAEVGVEQLSTNLVCRRAGLTPPALYRYFPNKYALLHELGVRLMNAQNELIARCITPEVLLDPVDKLQPALVHLFLQTHQVTAQATAGVWITRALRAVPSLQAVRLESHRAVTDEMHAALYALHPHVDPMRLRIDIRLSVDLMYSSMEMLFDEPDLDPRAVADSAAWLVHDLFVRTGVVRRPDTSRP